MSELRIFRMGESWVCAQGTQLVANMVRSGDSYVIESSSGTRLGVAVESLDEALSILIRFAKEFKGDR